MKLVKDSRQAVRRMALVAVFCAVAYVCQFLFSFKVAFLTFDAKDAVMTVGAMFFGPLWGIVMSLIVALLEMVTSGSGTGFYGFIMNFLSSAVFSALAAWIYRYKHTLLGAILGLTASVFGMTAVMLVFNLLITPLYMGGTTAEVAAMIPTLLLPFNLVKALFNAGLVLVLYKPISTALKRAKLLRGEHAEKAKFDKKSIPVLIAGVLLVVLCLVVFLVLLHGTVEWGTGT